MRLTCNLPLIRVIHQLETHRKAPTKPHVGKGGHKCHAHKLSDEQIRQIRARSHEGPERLAAEFNASVSYVKHIISYDVRVKHIF